MTDAAADIEGMEKPTHGDRQIPGITLLFVGLLTFALADAPATVKPTEWVSNCSGDVYALKDEPLLPSTV